MNITNKRLSVLLIGLYLIGMIVSAFTLFNIKGDLIYDYHILSISDVNTANAVFFRNYVVIGLTMIVGLFAIYFLYKGENTNVIYVEKTKEEERKEAEEADAERRKEDKVNPEELNKSFGVKSLKDPKNLDDLLTWICRNTEASQGAIYLKEIRDGVRVVKLQASYAMSIAESEEIIFEFGEGLVGQVAKEQKTLYLDDVPEGFVEIVSGLGSSSPSYLLLLPVKSEGQLTGVVEIASFVPFRANDVTTLEEFFSSVNTETNKEKRIKEMETEATMAEGEKQTEKKLPKKKKSEDK